MLSILAKYAVAMDHIAVAVTNLTKAIEHYEKLLGFTVTERREVSGKFSGMNSATLTAGKVTFVLVEATNKDSNVAQYIENYGPGMQHVAIEVTNIQEVYDDLAARGFKFITDIITAPGLEQAFSTRDEVSGLMIEIIQRAENKANFDDHNVNKLFTAMEEQGIY